MDLAYGPGELDYKEIKKGSGPDMKREYDSVDDFEHLEPEISPVGLKTTDLSVPEKPENLFKTEPVFDENLSEPFLQKSLKDDNSSFFQGSEPVAKDTGFSAGLDFLSDFDSGSKDPMSKNNASMKHGLDQSKLLDFGIGDIPSSKIDGNVEESDAFNASFISAEKDSNLSRADKENEKDIIDIQGFSSHDSFNSNKEELKPEKVLSSDKKSMKEDDALAQYNTKHEKDVKDIQGGGNIFSTTEGLDPEPFFQDEPQETKPVSDLKPEKELPKPEPKQSETTRMDSTKADIFTVHEDIPIVPTSISKPTPTSIDTVTKTSAADLDDIIGPEDVFKKIGLDAWFTPDRLHPTVEALVYWRDPKKSGVVFGSIMAILLSLCYMSLISVVAYSSLLALSGTICFRIYKNILQAVQKTSEGHPFKEFLDFDLSLPQDKVRETADTAVVHINAGLVELRRLFLVEDLIDSIKFAVCLWCLTYVGAIFNGMTLVILGFVALFTVPKIYENNKASIDQYIDIGRSKVAEITSKVKAALPVGKKEPEKDKEQ